MARVLACSKLASWLQKRTENVPDARANVSSTVHTGAMEEHRVPADVEVAAQTRASASETGQREKFDHSEEAQEGDAPGDLVYGFQDADRILMSDGVSDGQSVSEVDTTALERELSDVSIARTESHDSTRSTQRAKSAKSSYLVLTARAFLEAFSLPSLAGGSKKAGNQPETEAGKEPLLLGFKERHAWFRALVSVVSPRALNARLVQATRRGDLDAVMKYVARRVPTCLRQEVR